MALRALLALFFLLAAPEQSPSFPLPPDRPVMTVARLLTAHSGDSGGSLDAADIDAGSWDAERLDPALLLAGLIVTAGAAGCWRVIVSLRRARDRHKRESAQLMSIFESFTDGICVCDHRERTSLFANVVLKNLVGAPSADHACHLAGRVDDQPACPWCSLDGLAPGQTIKREARIAGLDHQITARAMVWPDGRTVTLLLLRDISERKKLDRLRDDVERMARHDLKTPLNGVMGFAQLLQINPSLDAEALGLVEDVMHNARLMLHIINGSLALLQMEQGSYSPRLRPFNLMESLRLLKADFAAELRAKRMTLTLAVNGREVTRLTEATAVGEKPFIESMLANVLRNAVEASPAGGEVAVRVCVGETLSIEVHNQGAAPKDMEKRFFEKYATSGKPRGVGLGTYSARLIARAHGGDATFTSSEEKGVVVRITLPQPVAPGAAARPRHSARHSNPDTAQETPMKIALPVLLSLLALTASPALAQPPAPPAPDTAGLTHFLSGQGFPAMDADKDGRISRQEFQDASARRFESLDGDKDGFVTRDEIRTARDQAKERRAQVREEREKRRQERQSQTAPKQ